MMEFFSVTEKVTNGKEIQVNLTEALKNDPTDGSSHYILGRFHFEASNLPWAVSAGFNRFIGNTLAADSQIIVRVETNTYTAHVYIYKTWGINRVNRPCLVHSYDIDIYLILFVTRKILD